MTGFASAVGRDSETLRLSGCHRLRVCQTGGIGEPHAGDEARAVALAQLRHLRAAPKTEWDRLHADLITRTRDAGASYNEIVLACTPTGE